MAAIYPADTFKEGVDLTIEASNQLAQVVRGDANTEVMVADGSTIPSIRKAQADSMYFKEPELWTTGQTETDYLQLKKYINPTTNKESWWFAKSATVLSPVAMGTSPFGDDNWTLYTPEDLFISGKAEYESVYQALKGKAAEAGYNLVRGSFEEGAVISGWPDVVWRQTDGKYYQWHLDAAKTVAAGSVPTNIGTDWLDKSNAFPNKLESTLEEFGGKADAYLSDGTLNPNKTDNYPALVKLIEAKTTFVPDRFGGNANNYTVGEIKLGVGAYYFGTPLSMKVHSIITGKGGGVAGGQQTIMLFDGDIIRGQGECSGITYHRIDTDYTSIGPVTSTSGADGSVLEGVTVRAINRVYQDELSARDQRYSGAWRRARAIFRDVQFERFGGHGYMTYASSTNSSYYPYGNANEWVDENVRADGNGYHGHYVFGLDVNAGGARKFSAVNNNGCGLWDESFLGNAYFNCHFNRNYRPTQYVTYDAGSGVKTWWCQNPNLAAETTPGSNELVWQQASSEAGLTARPWAEQTKFELAGAVVAFQHTIFVGTYVEKGYEGPIYLNGSCAWLQGLQEVGFSKISTESVTNFIVDSGFMWNPNMRRSIDSGKGTQSLTWFKLRDYIFNYSDGNGNTTNRLKMYYLTDTTPLTANMMGFAAGSNDYGLMYVVNANKAGLYGLKTGDTFLYGDIKIGGLNSPSIATTADTGKYYHRGSIILSRTVAAAGQNSYQQCTVAGLYGSTAVFVQHVL